jgi:hypothetical protein
MSFRSQFPRRAYTLAAFALMAIFYAAGPLPGAGAITIVTDTGTNHSHDQFQAGDSPGSPFFTQSTNSTTGQVYTIGPSNGLAGSISAPGGTPTGSSTTVSGTININGNATSAGADTIPGNADDWLNGNQIPAGVTLSFNVSFTVSSANGNMLITATGNTGNGLAIANDGTQTHGEINVGEDLNISAITTSNHTWGGAPTESFTFTPLSVGVTKFAAFRSNSFMEIAPDFEAATLTDGTTTWGFGAAAGTTPATSNLVMNNNYNVQFPPAGGDVPLTFSTSVGAWSLKGFQLRTPISYDVVAIETPADADFDNDGDVDGADFLIWQQNITDAGATPDQGDVDGNGTVDGVDLAAWGVQYGPAASPVASIPEPAALTMLLVAIGMMPPRRAAR